MIKKHNGKQKKVHDVLSLMSTEKISSEKRTIIGNLMHDFEAHQNDLLSELDNKIKKTELSIRKHFQSLTLELPLNMQNYTIEQIVESGGGIDLNANGDNDRCYAVIRIAKSLTQTNNDSNSLLQNITNNKSSSRHAFADVSAAVNSTSKRNNVDNKGVAHVIKIPLSASNKPETPNLNVRVLRSAVKTNGTHVKSKIVGRNSGKQEKAIADQSNANTTIKAKITNTSTLDITFKTPINQSLMPFLKKQPRKPVPNEEIVVCSKSGTPLVVDDSVVKQIISSNNIKQLK